MRTALPGGRGLPVPASGVPGRTWRAAAAALALAALAGGCTSNGPREAAGPSGSTFFPALPTPPRVQYLTTLAGLRDLVPATGGFAQFVAGDDPNPPGLRQPYGVAMHGGKLYVADSKLPGLAVFDLQARTFDTVTGTGSGRMRRPINVTIDRDGTKYVTDTGRDQVLVLDAYDRFVTAFGTEGQFRPVDTAIVGNRLYVVDIAHHEVHVLDKRTGVPQKKFGKAGSGDGELFHPTNIALGTEGDLYVVDTSNFRVQRFTPEGVWVRSYGQIGTTPGNFARPKGIAIDHEGRMFVGDAAFENVQIFDKTGNLLLYFGQPGEGPSPLNLPAGVSIDYDHVGCFSQYIDPRFRVEYLVLVASQFGPNKVDVFGFGRMDGMSYPPDEGGRARPARKAAAGTGCPARPGGE